jgi:hypothetical protein
LDVLAGLHQRVSFASPSALDSDAVIARRDITAVDADVLAGIDIDSVAVPAGCADGQVSNRDIFTIRGVDAPHQPVLRGEAVQANIAAADEFDERRMAERVLHGRPSAERRVSYDLSWTSDPDLIRVDRIN